ncbi:S6 family peptidase [Tatumella punctata]|uniref:S6 family peptidase n=1 Tax=Tatumella punctata TaxID=399969 RepID=A0ABW1VQQ7_9GAMM
MKRLSVTLLCSASLVPAPGNAGIMREDVPVQEYRDFAENLGKYRPGKQNVSVLKTDGSTAGILRYPIPDFGAVNTQGYATLISPSYIVSVRHNGGYKTANFGNNANFKTKYSLINRNDDTARDFHVPRLNKVVTEAAPVPTVKGKDLAKNKDRYQWFARVGAGTQYQVDADTGGLRYLSGAYQWKSGGTMTEPTFESWRLRWYNYSPEDPRVQPLDSSPRPGDSGSPMFVYDNQEKIWKLAGVLTSISGSEPYNLRGYVLFLQDAHLAAVQQENTDPAVTDRRSAGDILWSADSIRQADTQWQWHGTDTLIPALATNEQLDASKDLQFNGEGGTIILQQSVNHGAAKLQFSNNYQVVSGPGEDARWVGGGIEVDENYTVDWQVNGQAGDVLHKIGAGTLWVHGQGANPGALNTGDGVVILDQQPDSNGKIQAFSAVTLVSGRPTVVLNSADQVSSDNIQFGYRGGNLDLNGQSLAFSEIKHNDNGARLLNNNALQASEVTLYGADYQFSGSLGSPQASGKLNLTSLSDGRLSGGASLAELAVSSGHLQLAGQQELHAGNVLYSDDWQPQTYTAETARVATDSRLTVAEHATLNATTLLSDNAGLIMQARSTLQGSVLLETDRSQLIADISPRVSTLGELSAQIDAQITGEGTLEKTGTGRLTLTGDSSNKGGIRVREGELEVRSVVSGPLNMFAETTLSGPGRLGAVSGGKNVTFYPGLHRQSENDWAVMKMASLDIPDGGQLILNSGFRGTTTDRLLIEGDLNSRAGSPLLVSVNSQGIWRNTDTNGNNHADSNEGISLVQVGGASDETRVKLAGGYVARGAWAYDLYAFAPGKSDAGERLLTGEGNQYWDYRLQNILLNSDGNTVPVAPEPAPQPDPQPVPEPAPQPDPQPVPVPAPQPDPQPVPVPAPQPDPQPVPEPAPQPDPQPVRPATTPQVPSYISLPSALGNFSSAIQEMLSDSVRVQDRAIFAYGYHSEERYHTAGDFARYGYNFTSKSNGWMLGGRWQLAVSPWQQITVGAGVSKGSLSVKPSAADGDSRTAFDTLSINSLLRWQHRAGWWLEMPAGYTRFSGTVHTGLRGGVASPKAGSWTAGLDAGKRWQSATQSITPLLGIRWQYLNIRPFSDEDQAQVRYRIQRNPDFSAGAGYRLDLGNLTAGVDLRLIHRPGGGSQAIISDGLTSSSFSAGRGGDSVQLKTRAALRLTENTTLTTGMQYQTRLQKEGIDDWNILSGLEVSF